VVQVEPSLLPYYVKGGLVQGRNLRDQHQLLGIVLAPVAPTILVDRSRPAASTERLCEGSRSGSTEQFFSIEEQFFSRGMSPTSHYLPFASDPYWYLPFASDPYWYLPFGIQLYWYVPFASDPFFIGKTPHDCTSLINHLAN
jgi:hypothetical protein